jgi:predicted acetyltransferase
MYGSQTKQREGEAWELGREVKLRLRTDDRACVQVKDKWKPRDEQTASEQRQKSLRKSPTEWLGHVKNQRTKNKEPHGWVPQRIVRRFGAFAARMRGRS